MLVDTTLVDSHCHLDRLNLERYDNDLGLAVDAAHRAGVGHMLCVGIDLEHAGDVLGIAERFPHVCASVGVHPSESQKGLVSRESLLAHAQHEKVVAIGETGLDYYYGSEHSQIQQDSFRLHLDVAVEVGLPVIVHTRDAREDTIALIREYSSSGVTGVLHCFTENWAMAKQALDLGFYISISGIVTFKNAAELRDVVKKIPLDRLLIETDSPYLAPVPYRGKPNEPAYLPAVAHSVAGVLEISDDALASATTANFFNLFSRAESVLARSQ